MRIPIRTKLDVLLRINFFSTEQLRFCILDEECNLEEEKKEEEETGWVVDGNLWHV
jgi:hypothetical protein